MDIVRLTSNGDRTLARKTVELLISTHRQTIKDINDGKRFWKRGDDNTAHVKKACEQEITQCYRVLNALDHMDHGSLRKAEQLCREIREHLPNE